MSTATTARCPIRTAPLQPAPRATSRLAGAAAAVLLATLSLLALDRGLVHTHAAALAARPMKNAQPVASQPATAWIAANPTATTLR